MPTIPRDERESYRQWAKDNAGEQMDENGWVHESYWQSYLLRGEGMTQEASPASQARANTQLAPPEALEPRRPILRPRYG